MHSLFCPLHRWRRTTLLLLVALCVNMWDYYCSMSTKLTTALFRFVTTRYFNEHVKWYRYASYYDAKRHPHPAYGSASLTDAPGVHSGILGSDRARR